MGESEMRRLVIGVLILIVVGLGIGITMYLRTDNEDEAVAKPARGPTSEMLKERGPLPTESRLREGSRQVDNTSEALIMARESLARVEKELAETTDDAERMKIEKKRQLIQKAIERLTIK
jgi:hypothetical protein